jgi:hypothetical protein
MIPVWGAEWESQKRDRCGLDARTVAVIGRGTNVIGVKVLEFGVMTGKPALCSTFPGNQRL